VVAASATRPRCRPQAERAAGDDRDRQCRAHQQQRRREALDQQIGHRASEVVRQAPVALRHAHDESDEALGGRTVERKAARHRGLGFAGCEVARQRHRRPAGRGLDQREQQRLDQQPGDETGKQGAQRGRCQAAHRCHRP
jgi:hypothetical protein